MDFVCDKPEKLKWCRESVREDNWSPAKKPVHPRGIGEERDRLSWKQKEASVKLTMLCLKDLL